MKAHAFTLAAALGASCDSSRSAGRDPDAGADGTAAPDGPARPPAPDGPQPAPDAAADRAAGASDGPAAARDATGTPDVRPPDAAAARDGAPAAGDPPVGQYGRRAPMLDPNSEMAIAALGTKIYVLGGYPSSRVPVNTLQIYDTATNTWSRGERYPTTIHHPVLAAVGNKLYSLGGQISLTGQSDSARTFEYDPGANTWKELAPMPTARGGGAAAVIDDKIYVVSGRPPAANAFEVYDVSDNAWTRLPRLPQRYDNRNHLAAAAIGGKVYVAGGRYNGGGFGDPRTDALDMYDPASNTWVSKKAMLRVRGGMSSAVAFGCFHVYGGEGQGIGEPNDVYPDHDVYDPRTDAWTAMPRLPVPFHGVTGGAFIDGLIYMPGGGTASGGSSGSTMHQVFRPAMRCE